VKPLRSSRLSINSVSDPCAQGSNAGCSTQAGFSSRAKRRRVAMRGAWRRPLNVEILSAKACPKGASAIDVAWNSSFPVARKSSLQHHRVCMPHGLSRNWPLAPRDSSAGFNSASPPDGLNARFFAAMIIAKHMSRCQVYWTRLQQSVGSGERLRAPAAAPNATRGGGQLRAATIGVRIADFQRSNDPSRCCENMSMAGARMSLGGDQTLDDLALDSATFSHRQAPYHSLIHCQHMRMYRHGGLLQFRIPIAASFQPAISAHCWPRARH